MENVVFLTITYNIQAKIISDNLTAAGFKVVPLGIDIDYDDDREGRNRLMESQLLAELPQANCFCSKQIKLLLLKIKSLSLRVNLILILL